MNLRAKPMKWRSDRLSNLLSAIIDYRGLSVPKSETGVPLITAKNVREGTFDFTVREYIDESAYEVWARRGAPHGGDLLFTTEAPLGNAALFPEIERFAIGQRVVALRPLPDLINVGYLLQFLLSPIGKKRIDIFATGSTAKGISSAQLRKLVIDFPPLPQQQEISLALAQWDSAIEKTERLIAARERRHEGLIQTLISSRDARRHWGTIEFGNVVKERIEKSLTHDQYPVLTSSRRGLFLQSEYFSKQVTSVNNTGYKIMQRGDFTFRSMSDDGCFAFNRLSTLDSGIISPAYSVFYVTGCCPEFLLHFLNSFYFANVLNRESQGGTRKALRFSSIAGMEVDFPSSQEQERISVILDASLGEIKIEKQRLVFLRKQKRGFMKKLLSGEWSVSAPKEKTYG